MTFHMADIVLYIINTTIIMLERKKMINTIHAWDLFSLTLAYHSLRNINKFFDKHDLPLIHSQLNLPSVTHPPINISVPLY